VVQQSAKYLGSQVLLFDKRLSLSRNGVVHPHPLKGHLCRHLGTIGSTANVPMSNSILDQLTSKRITAFSSGRNVAPWHGGRTSDSSSRGRGYESYPLRRRVRSRASRSLIASVTTQYMYNLVHYTIVKWQRCFEAIGR